MSILRLKLIFFFFNRTNENEIISKIILQFFENHPTKLENYISATLKGMEILLKADKRKSQSVYKLDPSLTLRENLRNKEIIEHPVIYLILKDCRGSLNLIDSGNLVFIFPK